MYCMGREAFWGMAWGEGFFRLAPSSGAYRLGRLVNTVYIEGAGWGWKRFSTLPVCFVVGGVVAERLLDLSYRVCVADGDGCVDITREEELEGRVLSGNGRPILHSQLDSHPTTPKERLPNNLNSRPLTNTSCLGSIWAIRMTPRASFPEIIYIQPPSSPTAPHHRLPASASTAGPPRPPARTPASPTCSAPPGTGTCPH